MKKHLLDLTALVARAIAVHVASAHPISAALCLAVLVIMNYPPQAAGRL